MRGKRVTTSHFPLAIALLTLLLLSVVPVIAGPSDVWTCYLEPQDSTGECGALTKVSVKIGITSGTYPEGMCSYQDDIYYDPNCVNVKDVNQSMSPFTLNAWHLYGNYVRISSMNGLTEVPTGVYTIAVLTLECNGSSAPCSCDLTHQNHEANNEDGDPVTQEWINSTYTCRTVEKPDLVINNSVSLSNSNFTINYTVTNIGTGLANESTTCKYVDGELKESQTCPTLNPGESHKGTFNPESCPCGSTYNVTVCADRDNVINESDETNNCAVNIIECPTTKVDIRADGIAGTIFGVSRYSICPGTVTEDWYTITNETAMGALVIYCQNDGINVHIIMTDLGEYLVQIGNDSADNNNWKYAVNEKAPPVGGAQKAIADGDRVHWYNYNLHYYEVLTALDKTELIVGGNLTATVSWKNMTETHLLSGASVYVGALHPWGPETGTHVGTTGADGTCSFSWSNPGEWGVYAVDPVHGSGQYNWPYVTFTCRTEGMPDLVINKTVSFSDSTFTVNYTVTNIGIGRANESTTCKYLDGVLMESQRCPALEPGESYNGAFDPEPCPGGSTLNVTACADNHNVVNESDETNNCEGNIITCPSTTRVDIQAEGIAGTIFGVSGYSICPGTVTEDGVTINNETAMGAVVIYCQNNGINVQITMGSWGEYLLQIGDDQADINNWMYAVNEEAPQVGGAQKEIVDGDRVHWYNYNLHYYSVLTALDKTEIVVGENLTARVSWKAMGGTHPLSGASVYVGAMSPWGPEPGTPVGTTGADGADGTCTFSWPTVGTWGVYAIDPVHGSGQYNMPYVTFTCRTGGKPDLVISKTVSFSASTVTVNYTVTNIGIVRANESTTCKYVDGVLMESQTCPALDPGASHKGTFDPEPCPCGSTLNVTACADNNNVVNESDETNNCEVNIITCPSTTRVDIQADGIAGTIFDVSGYSICPGTVTEDGVTIKNETAMGAVVIYCQNNGINVQITIGALGEYLLQIGNDPADNNNWMYAVNEEAPPVGGAQKAIVDGDRVHWYNYKLNYYAVLTTLDKTEIFVGETITATVSWKGMDGTQPLSGASVYVGTMGPWGPEPGTHVGITGADGTCSLSWSNPGEWAVYAVDPVHGSGQYNMPYVTFTCKTGGKPDLVISKTVSFSASTFTVDYAVTNIGIVRANESTTCKYIDGVLMESQSCPALDPGASHKGTFDPEPCPGGSTLNVTACADNNNVVNESDETNNCEVNIITCSSTTSVDIRADGIADNIFDVSGYSIWPGTVTVDWVTIKNETAMGALVSYCQNNALNVQIAIGTWGEYVVQIGNDPIDNDNWMYAVNEEVPPVGGAQKEIVDGDRVHWYNYNLHYYEVLTAIDKTEIVVGENLTATVSWKDITGTHLLSGASVYVGAIGSGGPETGTHVGTTGVDGTCTFSWSNPGEWAVYAVDPVHGSGQYNWPYVTFTCRTGGKPDLEVYKTAFPTGGTVGTDVKFSINVTNTGNCTLNPVRVVDMLPAGMSYVATGTTPAPSSVVGNEVTWNNVSSLDPSDSTIISLIAHIDEGASGTLINDVTATGTPPYGADVHDSDTATVTVMNVSISINKSCSPTIVAPGGILTYTISCSNSGVANLTNVTITEDYPEGITFISANPAPDPGTNNMWTIGILPVGEFRTITIKVKVPDSRDIAFTETGSVTGEGFVMVSKELSTKQEPYTLKNVVTIECAETDPVTASAFTTVSGMPGTSLEITESGSGNYKSEEILNLETKNKSIGLQKSTEAEYQPTTFNFSDSFSVNFTTLWKQDICSKNLVLKDAMHKKIKDATYIKDDTITEMGAYGTSMEFDSSFYGAAHIGAVSKDITTSEDYIGEFELYWATREECRYLFNWSQVPGNDSEKLIRYLVDVLAIKWAVNATITKSSDDKIIHISTDGRSAEIVMGANNETATVKVGAETIYVLEVRTEDGTLNVYDRRLKEMSESVRGVGYVMVDNALSKGQIQVVEHGSGNYSSDMVFDSHQLDKDTEAEYLPTTFNFSGDFGVNFSSMWVQGICAKNEKADTAIHKKISDASSMVDDTNATKSTMRFESSFNGSMHIGVGTNNTKISEDYIGEFYVVEAIEIRNKNVTSQKEKEEEWMECP